METVDSPPIPSRCSILIDQNWNPRPPGWLIRCPSRSHPFWLNERNKLITNIVGHELNDKRAGLRKMPHRRHSATNGRINRIKREEERERVSKSGSRFLLVHMIRQPDKTRKTQQTKREKKCRMAPKQSGSHSVEIIDKRKERESKREREKTKQGPMSPNNKQGNKR